MDRKLIEKKLEEYRRTADAYLQEVHHTANWQNHVANNGAAQAMEQLLAEIDRVGQKDDKTGKNSERT